MKILIVNGSPRGRFSVTLQTCLYLEKRFPGHSFEYLNAGAGIQGFERDMAPAAAAFRRAELVIFAYPVYTFLVPSQLHRFLELMKEQNVAVRGQYVTQLTTSKHFFDVTAHRFVEENCRDMGMRVIRGLSADMDDLLTEKGQKEAEQFLEYAVFCAENGIWEELAGTEQTKESFEDTEEGRNRLRELIRTLRKRCKALEEEIRHIKTSFPYTAKALLDDDKALEMKRQELLDQLAEVRALLEKVDEYIAELKRRMNEKKRAE